ncbi:hypothetical protein B9Z55_006413 [Caenorhabditis nigoni]|uniref:Uncharacterized protein n=1 Tax=Caenorhabditis nigoni TaxID=1611254 RepID=A0A2G5V538_9PELO|nr:hypothetical protein B9Z55_006413 [Caenorhabditis nigoni]
MAMANRQNRRDKLPPEVNRILYIKNLPYKITTKEIASQRPVTVFEKQAERTEASQKLAASCRKSTRIQRSKEDEEPSKYVKNHEQT